MIAGLSPRPASRFLSTQLSVKFRSPPGNHRGHSIPRAASSTRVYGFVQRTPRSRTTASQYHSGSSLHRFQRADLVGPHEPPDARALDILPRGPPDDLAANVLAHPASALDLAPRGASQWRSR